MIGGKLGEVLNKDIGALVKDAGKVLNADIGDLVRAKKVEAAATTDVPTVFEPAYAKERLDETLVVRHNYAVPTGSDSAVRPASLNCLKKATLLSPLSVLKMASGAAS